MTNTDIRNKAKAQGVRLWEIAEALGVSEFTFSRKLRHELPDGERERVMEAIARVAEGKAVQV